MSSTSTEVRTADVTSEPVTASEIMVTAASKEVHDGEVAVVGIGLPQVACVLAQRTTSLKSRFSTIIVAGLSLAYCESAIASAVHLVCDGHISRQYPKESPPEPEALSVTIDENAGTVTISHYGQETIQKPLLSDLVKFGDGKAGVLTGSIERFTGVIEFRLTTSNMEPLMHYRGSARPLF